MKIVALVSGGKDSCYNMMQCVAEGHTIVALANLFPSDKDELDSYMYQTVGHHAIDLYAQAMGLPIYRRVIQGQPISIDALYTVAHGDEVEDLYMLLKDIKEKCGIEGVSVGAIMSDYQRVRVENVCDRLGLTSFAFLWRRDQRELLQEMIDAGVRAIVIKVAALGLDPSKHLGMSLEDIYPHMVEMNSRYGLNICGEGGEYETFTLDCPLFVQSIVIDSRETVQHSEDAFAPVAYLNLLEMHCEPKHITPTCERRYPNHGVTDSPQTDSVLSPHGINTDGISADGMIYTDGISNQMCDVLHISSNYHVSTLEHYDQPHISTNEKGEFWIAGVTGLFTAEHSTVEDVAHAALTSIQKTVQCDCHASLADVISVCMYIRDIDDYQSIDAVYKNYFTSDPPVRLCVGAYLPRDVHLRFDLYGRRSDLAHSRRRSMHVRSVSHWAPASIGHYSQAILVGDTIHTSGQIALEPSTNVLVPGGIIPQCRLSLRHVTRILEAMHSGMNLLDCVNVTCFVVDRMDIDCINEEWRRFLRLTQGDSNLCSIRYIVVHSLPRGALVEWSVTATTSSTATCHSTESDQLDT